MAGDITKNKGVIHTSKHGEGFDSFKKSFNQTQWLEAMKQGLFLQSRQPESKMLSPNVEDLVSKKTEIS